MMRALWSAASGMKIEQTAVDNIANNLANVNTLGYKEQTAQFKTLLYQNLQAQTTTANGTNKPSSAQVGLGARVASINASYTQGAQLESDNPMACCINGNGFFAVTGPDQQTYYTRSGDFLWATSNEDGQLVLTDPNGNPIQDREGERILLPENISSNNVSVGSDGSIMYRDPTSDTGFTDTGQFIALYQFPNTTGLEKTANNLSMSTISSGQAIAEWDADATLTPSTIAQGYIEGSNVNIADEMVSMIVSQRAYESNSKAITTSDSMLQTANELKR